MTSAAEIVNVSFGQPLHRQIDITIEPDAIRAITDAICTKAIPDLYLRSGCVTRVLLIDDGVTGAKLIMRPVDADSLRQLLAMYADCYRVKMVAGPKGPEPKMVPALPTVSTAKAILSASDWPGLPILAGVTSFPLIRTDGTVQADEGYDEATRLYYRPAYKVRPIPEMPSPEDVAWARNFILGKVLHDVCFDGDASRANYLALLATPLMRLYLGGLLPFGVISAVTAGSGKTLLTQVLKAVYKANLKPWARTDDEMGKVITATLKDDVEPVIVFDNVGSFDTVEHATLAALLTSKEWSNRLLGASSNTSGVNDRLWCCTGNNVALGGDIPARSVLVRLDPGVENPEERSGFVIEDIWSWLDDDENRSNLLAALLVLVRAWMVAGAPKDTSLRMRNYTAWAQTMGGLLEFHGIPGFLTNKQELAISNDDETATAAFLVKWYEKYGDAKKGATDLVDSARSQLIGNDWHDPWDGVFPTRPDGKPFTSKGLGRYLQARRGKLFGGLKLVHEQDKHAKVNYYRVTKVEMATQEVAA